jgi:hypothetical protein
MSHPLDVVLPVTLEHDFRPGDSDNMLVINGGDHSIEFDRITPIDERTHHANRPFHTITLKLSGNARSGEFCSLVDPEYPGFSWLMRVPLLIVLVQHGKDTFVLQNHHYHSGDPRTKGRWFYQLAARFGDQVYGVPLTFAAGPSNNKNPSIKNR